ncbi:unnamed protein product [Acidithrix sp. C25]|nr:unnamed protein product [Acidithrix sp. C25]
MADNIRTRTLAPKLMPWVAFTTTALTYALVGLGSTVRVTNSGMGCPSWPLCYGQIGPIFKYHPILEESHRYLAGIVSIFVFSTLALVLANRERGPVRKAAQIAAGLVVFQIGLGGLTVLARNAPWTVALHLLTGLTFLASTTVVCVLGFTKDRFEHLSRVARRWGMWSLETTLALLFSGSLVVGSGAGAACPTWPVCFANGPARLTAIALFHRMMMGASAIVIVAFVVAAWSSADKRWKMRSKFLVILLGVVAAVGAGVALSKSNPVWADIHLGVAAALWVTLTVQVWTHGLGAKTISSTKVADELTPK